MSKIYSWGSSFVLILIAVIHFYFQDKVQAQEMKDTITPQTYADYWGNPFEIDGEWLWTFGGGSGIGEIYTYQNIDDQWQFQGSLMNVNSSDLGYNLDLSGDWAVAADGGTYIPEVEVATSAFFYKLEHNTWTSKQHFWKERYGFGESLSMDGEWTIIADPRQDTLYVYHLQNDSWIEHQKIAYDDTTNVSESPGFGDKIKIHGDYFVAGCRYYDTANIYNSSTGAYYIYKRQQDNTWTLLHSIVLEDLLGPKLGQGMGFDFNTNTIAANFVDPGEQSNIHIFEFSDSEFRQVDSLKPSEAYSIGDGIDLEGNDLVFSEPYANGERGRYYHYKKQGDGWSLLYAFDNPTLDQEFGRDMQIYNETIFATLNIRSEISNGGIMMVGVKKPEIISVSNGHSKSYTKINWDNFSEIQDGFIIYRDGEEIATTSGNARSFFDYEGIPGKTHTYSVTAYDPESTLQSRPSTGTGYRQPSGLVEGKVQTPLGAGVRDVNVTLTPVEPGIHRAVYFDSAANTISIPEFRDFPDSAFTVSFWTRPASADNNGTLFDYTSSSDDDALSLKNPENLELWINGRSLSTGLQLTSSRWQHVSVTWRNSDGRLHVLLDGVRSFESKFMAGERFESGGDLFLGQDFVADSLEFLDENQFKGWIDEVGIWNTALTDSSIAAERFKKRTGNEDHLVSYYGFDDPARLGQNLLADMVWRSPNHGNVTVPLFETDPGNVMVMQRQAGTDAGGKFSFKNVYYDAGREFELTPSKPNHGFAPGSSVLRLDQDNSQDKSVTFDDTTSFTVGGRVYYSSSDCNLGGAEILLNGKPTGVVTKSDGTYQITVEEAGTYQLSVSYADTAVSHRFRPSALNLEVSDNLFNVDFADITTSRLHGRVGAACNTSLGKATLQVTSLGNPSGCFTQMIETDDDGYYSVDLPSQAYRIEVVDLVPANPAILQTYDIVNTDLTFQDTLLNFVYRDPLTIRINGLPPVCIGADEPFRVPVVRQFEQYFLTIEVIESYNGDSCLVDTGMVTIYDAVGDRENDPLELNVSNGQAYYILSPGKPNILDGGDHPFQKLFQVVADIDGDVISKEQFMLVAGHRPRSETFVTKTPEIPLLILRDPPGDQSYAYFEKDSSFNSNFTMSHEIGGGAGVYTDIKIGAGIPVPFTGIVIGARTHIEGKIIAGKNNNNGTTISTTFSNTERFSTSDSDNITGSKGDVFMGASFNMIYALTDVIDFDEETCSVVRDTQLVWGSEEINTSYIYTGNHIRNTLLPQLRQLRTLASPDSAVLLSTYIDVWEQVLEDNERMKRNARQERNLSFSSGATREYSKTTTKDSSISIDFTVFVDSEVKVGVGIGDGEFSDIEIGAAAQFRWSKTEIRDTTFTTSTRVGYLLGDDDPGDFFSVDVKTDPVYKTPVFDLVSGRSSCPFEPGTQPRDGVQLTMDSYVRNNVPQGEKAAFTLFLGNTSQSDETRDYALSVVQSSNLDGAIISVGGVVIEDALHYTIPAGEQFNATLAVARGPLAWDYENLKVRLYAPCDPSISDTVTFSVHYDSPCSNVNIFLPANNWLANINNNDTLQVVLNDYDSSDPDLEMIKFEYRPLGEAWKTAFTINKNELPDDFVSYPWDISRIPNGEYELRAAARCGAQGVSYSAIVPGAIDRSALVVFGQPQPSDGILNIGEDIKVAFTEELDCDALSENAATLTDENDQEIPVRLTCSGNELIIILEQDPATLEGRLITVTVSSVQDISGNILREPYSWEFVINQNPLYWNISNTRFTAYKTMDLSFEGVLRNAGGQSEGFELISVPDWLSTGSTAGSVPSGGSLSILFEVSENLNPGQYSDTLYARTASGDEAFFVEVFLLASPPEWSVNASEFSYSMTVTAQLNIQGNPSDDPFDMVSAFSESDIRGMSNVEFVSDAYGYLVFLTVYSNTVSGDQIRFRGWDASEGDEYGNVDKVISFSDGESIGSLSNPLILNPQGVAQNTDLNSGWTWVSFFVEDEKMRISSVLEELQAADGDIVKSQTEFAQYVEGTGWQGSLQEMEVGKAYFFRLSDQRTLRFIGNRVSASDKVLRIGRGWNWIGYVNNRILDINTALQNFSPADGDRIKSQTSFAEYNSDMNSWIGSLEFLQPGNGYLINSSTTSAFNFAGAEKSGTIADQTNIPESWSPNPQAFEFNMSVIADFEITGLRSSDSLDVVAAFVDGECRGTANPVFVPALNRYQYFLTVYGDTSASQEIEFRVLENETGIVYQSGSTMWFRPDSLAGSVISPVLLSSAYATDEGALPVHFKLYQNYPNPFNPVTTIRYELAERTDVKLAVYNVLGQEVAVLVNEAQNAGRYAVDFDASFFNLSSGLYIYRFKAGGYSEVHKSLLVR